MTFPRGIDWSPATAIVEAIVGIATGMGKNTVAEFVTDRDMMDRLRRSGIDYAQGFGVGVPQPAVETFGDSEPRWLIPASSCARQDRVTPSRCAIG